MVEFAGVVPGERRRSGKHWLKQSGELAEVREVWTWRSGIRHWQHRCGKLRTPEFMARHGYSYDRPWSDGDAPDDACA